MRVIKKAHNKEVIKISKSDWESIGKTAGWMKTAGDAADWEIDRQMGFHDKPSGSFEAWNAPISPEEKARIKEKKKQKEIYKVVAGPLTKKPPQSLPPEVQKTWENMADMVSRHAIPFGRGLNNVVKKLVPIILKDPEFKRTVHESYNVHYDELDQKTKDQLTTRVFNYCTNRLVSPFMKARSVSFRKRIGF